MLIRCGYAGSKITRRRIDVRNLRRRLRNIGRTVAEVKYVGRNRISVDVAGACRV